MNATTISSWALLIVKALEHQGYSCDSVFTTLGMDPKKLKDNNARYSTQQMQQLWRTAVELTGDPTFGIKVASYWHPTTFHALGYSWMASGSLKEAMERAVRYSKVVSDLVQLYFDYVNGAYKFSIGLQIQDTQLVSESIDASAAVFVNMVRLVYGDEIHPILVTLPRAKPAAAKEFSEFFNAPIEYDSHETALFYIDEQVEKSLPTGNVELAHANDKIVKDYLSHLDKTNVSMQVKSKIVDLLSSGMVTEQDMAEALHVSLRSLQRKLREEGTSYKEILEGTRKELATKYIQNSRLSISEISFLLGFSEISNFSRAFKRWNGRAPSDYRAGL
ncbi:AraC family transcriptional regulator [Kaarinaea lacus]